MYHRLLLISDDDFWLAILLCDSDPLICDNNGKPKFLRKSGCLWGATQFSAFWLVRCTTFVFLTVVLGVKKNLAYNYLAKLICSIIKHPSFCWSINMKINGPWISMHRITWWFRATQAQYRFHIYVVSLQGQLTEKKLSYFQIGGECVQIALQSYIWLFWLFLHMTGCQVQVTFNAYKSYLKYFLGISLPAVVTWFLH